MVAILLSHTDCSEEMAYWSSESMCGIIGPLGLFYLLIYVRNRYEAQVCEVSFTGGLWPYKVRIQSRSSRYVLKLCKCRLEIDRKVSKRWQFEADEYILDEITLLMIGGFGRWFDKQQRPWSVSVGKENCEMWKNDLVTTERLWSISDGEIASFGEILGTQK